MEFPLDLKAALEKQAAKYRHSDLKQAARAISDRYREGGNKRLTKEIEAAAYAVTRMPATYGAVSDALSYSLKHREAATLKHRGALTLERRETSTLRNSGSEWGSVLDAGAGCGAASWAAASFLRPETVTCLEREGVMRKIGESLMQEGAFASATVGAFAPNVHWMDADLMTADFQKKYDLVIASYVINELAESDREEAVMKLWQAADRMLLLVEPGTPAGFAVLQKAREILLDAGAHIAAPCPHEQACRLAADDWCHFTSRIPRSKLHKELKDGDAPFEDEKYTYIAFVREETKNAGARILRHPYIEKGRITLEVCGETENKTLRITKKDGKLFKTARKAKCGDEI